MSAIIAILALLVCVTTPANAQKDDVLLWTAPINNSNVYPQRGTQWIATAPSGSVIVLDGKHNLTSLDPNTGAVVWSVTHKKMNMKYMDGFAASSSVVLLGAGGDDKLRAFDLHNGTLLHSIDFRLGEFFEASCILVQDELFVVFGRSIGVFGPDLTLRFSILIAERNLVYNFGTSNGYFFYTEQIYEGGTGAELVIVSLTTFEVKRLNNITLVSTYAADGKVIVRGYPRNTIGCVSLATGTYVWLNTEIASAIHLATTFVLMPSSSVPIVVAESSVYAFDPQFGFVLWNVTMPYDWIGEPRVVEERVVFLGFDLSTGYGGTLVSVDVTTGVYSHLQIPTRSYNSVPNDGRRPWPPVVMATAGHSVVVLNSQGYSRINFLTMTPESHNLDIPMQWGITTLSRAVANSTVTTFVTAGVHEAAAFTLGDL